MRTLIAILFFIWAICACMEIKIGWVAFATFLSLLVIGFCVVAVCYEKDTE